MLLDVVEQRLRGWETRRKKEGPKKIEVRCDVLSLYYLDSTSGVG
jgi:hypothetical protein